MSSTAERQLLAALVAGRDLDVAAFVRPDDFADPKHQALWRAGWDVIDAGSRVTPVALERAVRALGSEDIVGGIEAIAAFDSGYTSEQDIREAAHAVRAAAMSRQLAEIGQELVAAAKGGHDPDQVLAEHTRRLELLDSRTVDEPVTLARAMRERVQEARREVHEGAKAPRLSTGLPSLDRALKGGLRPGWQVVIGARPGMGKSALALQLARAAGRQGSPVLLVSAEMTAEELAERALAGESDVTIDAIEQGPGEIEIRSLEAAAERAGRYPIEIDDRTTTLDDLLPKVRRWRRRNRGGIGLLVVDYVQLLGGPRERGDSREREIAGVSRALKQLAQQLGICTLVLSQLNRQLEARPDKRPQLSDLRESGAIEQDANLVMFLYRPWVYDKTKDPGAVELLIRKFRGGRSPQTIRLVFAPSITSFGDAPEGP